MFLFDNPVLQHELVRNLRMNRAFLLLLLYLATLGGVVYLAWPQQRYLDMTHPEASKILINLFFGGQFLLASLMAPTFSAGSLTGEKERKSYEMLLASPLRPTAVVLGKLFASLCPIGLLIVASLPIVMLCIPLGGVSVYEVFVAYWFLGSQVVLFGVISLACSCYFRRTAASLVVSYLLILPLALLGAGLWLLLERFGSSRLLVISLIPIAAGLVVGWPLIHWTARRLLYPPDIGAAAAEMTLEDQERTVGLVIASHRFPDRLFVPSKRRDLLEDNANPVFDKEMRSEIFSQETLMLRVVIQVSMALSMVLMAVCLFLVVDLAPWYISYVILFNVMVGPVFAAGAITSERERGTLDLLLTTTLHPMQILWAKLVASLRVSSVLTLFLMWAVVLAAIAVEELRSHSSIVAGYFGIILMTCLSTCMIAMFCSTLFQKTSTSLMTSYAVIGLLFLAPVATQAFIATFFPKGSTSPYLYATEMLSPVSAAFHLPIEVELRGMKIPKRADWIFFASFILCHAVMNLGLLLGMTRILNRRWRAHG